MKLLQEMRGDEATQLIDRLHGKGVSPEENHIAFYADAENGAVLYLSRYSDELEASSEEQKMARGIKAGNPVFAKYRELSLGDQRVSRCVGMGQIHFFFARGAQLCWLSADPPVAQQALDDLLR